jgi:hypothetical protein
VTPLGVIVTTCAPPGEVGDSRVRAWAPFVRPLADLFERNAVEPVWIVADDASAPEHRVEFKWSSLLVNNVDGGQRLVFLPSEHRSGVGASLNRAIAWAADNGIDTTLYAVDDWELHDGGLPLGDMIEWLQQPSIGFLRLGPPHPGLSGVTHTGWPFNFWWTNLDWSAGGFVFSHRPALYHARFWASAGWHPEGLSALETERIYNEHACRRARHLTAGMWIPSAWDVIPNAELGDVQP